VSLSKVIIADCSTDSFDWIYWLLPIVTNCVTGCIAGWRL